MQSTEDYLQAPKVKEWITTIKNSGATIKDIRPLAVNYKPNGELLFAYLDTNIISVDGTLLPSYIFIRGHAVLVVVVVQNRETKEERFVMVEQRRIATGAITLEFPAGMVDEKIDNPAFVAIKELAEETGLTILPEQLIPLTSTLLYSTPGACDEGLYFYTTTLQLSSTDFNTLHGQLRINQEENEHIRVVLATENEFRQRNSSIQALTAYFLYKEFCEKRDSPCEK